MKYETITKNHLRVLIWWASWGLTRAKGGSMMGTCRGAIRANMDKCFKAEEDKESILRDIGDKKDKVRSIY